jgi:hypothetical protein
MNSAQEVAIAYPFFTPYLLINLCDIFASPMLKALVESSLDHADPLNLPQAPTLYQCSLRRLGRVTSARQNFLTKEKESLWMMREMVYVELLRSERQCDRIGVRS